MKEWPVAMAVAFFLAIHKGSALKKIKKGKGGLILFVALLVLVAMATVRTSGESG